MLPVCSKAQVMKRSYLFLILFLFLVFFFTAYKCGFNKKELEKYLFLDSLIVIFFVL